MQYGSGAYEVSRYCLSNPVLAIRPEAYENASKHMGSGVYGCLNQPKVSYWKSSELLLLLLKLIRIKRVYFIYYP